MVSKTPAHWYPDHPGYPLHLALTQLRFAVAAARATLEQLGHVAPARVVARALATLALEADALCQHGQAATEIEGDRP